MKTYLSRGNNMSNNTPDYNDNLAFEPKMTWEELCEWVKENKSLPADTLISERYIEIRQLTFYKGHEVDAGITIIAEECTYEQMKTIIEALWG
jgi:hypothetical protein